MTIPGCEQNHRGATKGCIERNTFPHKFKKVPREKSEGNNDEDEEGDKCTICLCGKTAEPFFSFMVNATNLLMFSWCVKYFQKWMTERTCVVCPVCIYFTSR